MRPDRGPTSSPSPSDGDRDADLRAEESRPTPVPATPAAPVVPKDEPTREALDDLLAAAPQGELERPTLVPEIDLQALAKLGPEAFAHSNQRLPADLFGPGGRPSAPVRTSLPPGASMVPRDGSMRPSMTPSLRPKADPFDLDEVDVFFDDNRTSVAPYALATDDLITEPPHLDLEATAELLSGANVPSEARQTSRPPPPLAPHAAPTVRRMEVASFLESEDEVEEPTLSNRLAPLLTPPRSSAPPPPSSLAMPPAPLPAPAVIETSDAIDALGMLDNPDSWDEIAAVAAEPQASVSASLRPLAAAALDSLAQLDDPDDDDLGDDLAVPVPSPLPPTRPQPESTAPPESLDAVASLSSPLPPRPPIESLPSDLLADDDSTDDLAALTEASGALDVPLVARTSEEDLVADAGADEAMAELRDRFAANDYLGALHLAETLTNDPLHAQEAEQIAEECRVTLQARYVESIGSLARVPVIAVPLSVIRELPIDNRAGFVLSRIDGISSLEMILDMCGMSQLDALRIVYELVQNGALDFV
jgi:hypothetical protein